MLSAINTSLLVFAFCPTRSELLRDADFAWALLRSAPPSPDAATVATKAALGPKAKRAVSYACGQGDTLTVSATMPVMPRHASAQTVSAASGGFLSRMWAATKGGDRDRDEHGEHGADTAHGPASALRRLAHSKSALFRSQQPPALEA